MGFPEFSNAPKILAAVNSFWIATQLTFKTPQSEKLEAYNSILVQKRRNSPLPHSILSLLIARWEVTPTYKIDKNLVNHIPLFMNLHHLLLDAPAAHVHLLLLLVFATHLLCSSNLHIHDGVALKLGLARGQPRQDFMKTSY